MIKLYGGRRRKKVKRSRRATRKTIILTSSLVLALVMCYSGVMLARTGETYREEGLYHQALLVYKPQVNPSTVTFAAPELPAPESPEPSVGVFENESLVELQTNYPDVVGWLTVPGTQIDYPFVQAEDNDRYLHADLDGNELSSGTLFMDCRAGPGLASFNTIIYGHHMKNGSMFGSLPGFKNADVFDKYKTGTLLLPHANYTLEIFACALTDRYDALSYNCLQQTQEEKQAFLDHVKEIASQYRDIGVTVDDAIITLSTCSYEFADARTLLLCRLVPAAPAPQYAE